MVILCTGKVFVVVLRISSQSTTAGRRLLPKKSQTLLQHNSRQTPEIEEFVEELKEEPGIEQAFNRGRRKIAR